MEFEVRITSVTPKQLAFSIVHGKVDAIHSLTLEAHDRLFHLLSRRRVTKREMRLEIELVKGLLWQVIKMQQELLQELESVAYTG